MSKQKFEVELEVPDGWEIVDYRPVRPEEKFLNPDCKVRTWDFVSESRYSTFILRKIPKYREPVLPADWGKAARFSYDGNEWVEGRLASYAAHYADDKHRWGSAGNPYWYAYCQVVDE